MNLESIGTKEDIVNNKRVAEIEEILQNRSKAKAGIASYGDRVVFFDLEWHKLDKKLSEETTKSYGRSLTTAHICQICAISANYSLRFNQYISYRKLKPAWMRLVNDKVLELSPQDDPQIAISTEDAFEMLIQSFPDDCLFLSYGNTDAASIFKTLSAEADYDQYNDITPLDPDRIEKRQDILARLQKKKWRWANVMHWMKQKGKDLNLEKDHITIAGSLGRLYDVIFHHSLWVSYPTPAEPGRLDKEMKPSEIVESEPFKRALEPHLQEFPANLKNDAHFGLVPREWLEVKRNEMRNPENGPPQFKNCFPQFWPTSHLEPVFHVAHTDTIMTINCAAMLCLVSMKDFETLLDTLAVKTRTNKDVLEVYRKVKGIPDKNDKDSAKVNRYQEGLIEHFAATHQRPVEARFNSVATSTIKKTWFFRKFQLSLSENSAKEIWDWYDTTPAPKENSKGFWYRTTQQMRYRNYVLACKAIGRRANKYDVGDYDIDLNDENYVIKSIVRHIISKSKGKLVVWYQVQWEDPDNQWSGKEWWVRRADLAGAQKMLAEFEAELPPAELAKIRKVEPLVNLVRSDSSSSSSSSSVKSTRDFKAEPKLKVDSVLVLEEAEEAAASEFVNDGKEPATYFTIKQPVVDGVPNENYEELVMTRRKGKFTDKIKAIRRFLLHEAKRTKDTALETFLVQKDVPFSEKRQMRFPMDPKKFYDGLPWFSLQTSVAEPRTEMLHTLDCRNLTDNRARTFADFEVFLWDFDIIVQQRIFLNTRFRFCKECKEYTGVLDPAKSGNLTIDALLKKYGRPTKTAAPMPEPIEEPSSPIRRSSSTASSGTKASSSSSGSSSGSWVSARMSRSSGQKLKRPEPGSYPLTNLVSYFAIRSSLAEDL